MNKNDIFETEITDITDMGLGVGKADGMTLFVKNAAVGDRVSVIITKLKKNYAFAAVKEIIKPSKSRIKPDCAVFPRCGGCVMRHISYESELKIKENRVGETMKRLGKVNINPNEIISGAPDFYRNKAQYPVSEDGLGFYAAHSHRVVKTDCCLLSPLEFSAAANAFYEFLKQKNIPVYNDETKKGLVRHFYLRKGFSSGEIQAVIVINGEKMPFAEDMVNVLKSVFNDALKSVVVNINRKDTNVVLGDKSYTVFGTDYIFDTLSGVKVRLSPYSFYQVNSAMAEKLYAKAKEYAAPKGKTVLDLYCGAGTIGLSMSNEAKEIIGVEIVPQAVEDAKFNAQNNGIKNARFICADAAGAAEKLREENLSPDVVVLDPPRKGCEEQLLKTVAQGFAPERIVYVSCDVATLARDTAVLETLGYKLKEYTPCDLFPRTAHVETVALFRRIDYEI